MENPKINNLFNACATQPVDCISDDLKYGMQQLLGQFKRLTEQLKKSRTQRNKVFEKLMFVWRAFEVFLSWAFNQRGAREVRKIAKQGKAQRVLHNFNIALHGYCRRYKLCQIPSLDLEQCIRNLDGFKKQVVYIHLIWLLQSGLHEFEGLLSQIRTLAFIKPIKENDIILSKLLQALFHRGNILQCLNVVQGIPTPFWTDDSLRHINQKIMDYQNVFQKILNSTSQGLLPPALYEH